MKKSLTLSVAAVCTCVSSFAQLSPEITTWILTGGQGQFDAVHSNLQQVQYTDNAVYLSCYGIPTYDVGPWDDPALGSNQNFVFSISRNPVEAAEHILLSEGHIGVWSNGLSVFDVHNGISYRTKDTWHVDGTRAADFQNPCDGFAAENGEFYSRTAPSCLYIPDASAIEHAPILGYAFDGFPIYGGYGFANADGSGGVVRMQSSWQHRNMTERNSLPDGTQLPEELWGPAVSEDYPLGHYIEDYIYVAGSGDLDAHNGRFCVTPEYPNGTYAYFATVNAEQIPQFPYVIGKSYYGTPDIANLGEYSGHATIDDAALTYSSTGSPEAIAMLVYPNPSTDFFHIYIQPSYENNITATLTDMQGRNVFIAHNWQPGVNYPIDVRGFGSGVYVLKLKTAHSESVVQCVIR